VSWTHFDRLNEDGEPRPAGDESLARHRDLDEAGELLTLLRRLNRCRRAGRQQEARLWLAAALTLLAEEDHRRQIKRPANPIDSAIDALVDRMRIKPGATWIITDLAARCHCSADHFTRRFRKLHGLTPRRFIVQCRMDRARDLLRFTTCSIGEIADQLGYQDQGYFCRQFTEECGQPPSQWRLTC
jgi:AraC-like DNA-binding protein